MFNANEVQIKKAFSFSKSHDLSELMDRIVTFSLLQGGFDVFIALDEGEEAETPFIEVLASTGLLPIKNLHPSAVVGIKIDEERLTIKAYKLGWEVILQGLLKASTFEYVSLEEMRSNSEPVEEYDYINDPKLKLGGLLKKYEVQIIEPEFYNGLEEMPLFLNKVLKPINNSPIMMKVYRVEVKDEVCNIYDKKGILLGRGKLKSLSKDSIYIEVNSFKWECYSLAQFLNLEPHNRADNEFKVQELINNYGVSTLTLTKLGFLETFIDLLSPLNGFSGLPTVSEQYKEDAKTALSVMAERPVNKVTILNFPERFIPNNASMVFWKKVDYLMRNGYVFKVTTSDLISGNFCQHFFDTKIKRIDPTTKEIETITYGHNDGISHFYGRDTMSMFEDINF